MWVVLVASGCSGAPERSSALDVESIAGAVAAAEAGVAVWTPQDPHFPVSRVADPARTTDAESVEVSADGGALTVVVTGAARRATEPCGEDYAGFAVTGPRAVALVVAVDDPTPDETCSAVGVSRQVVVPLSEPLGGRTLVGVDGTPVAVVGDRAPCSRSWTADMPADVEGASEPLGAIADWLARDPSSATAPEVGTPQEGWSPRGDVVDDRVVLVRDGFEVTTSRSTRGEWAVTAVSCGAS